MDLQEGATAKDRTEKSEGKSMTDCYEDIIRLPHHVLKKHPRMAVIDRAAQVSPFAALTDYGDTLKKTARLTEHRIILSDDEKAVLDERLRIAVSQAAQHPVLTITYFVPDRKKDDGAYVTITGSLKRIDECDPTIQMPDGTKTPIENIIQINGDIFDKCNT